MRFGPEIVTKIMIICILNLPSFVTYLFLICDLTPKTLPKSPEIEHVLVTKFTLYVKMSGKHRINWVKLFPKMTHKFTLYADYPRKLDQNHHKMHLKMARKITLYADPSEI